MIKYITAPDGTSIPLYLGLVLFSHKINEASIAAVRYHTAEVKHASTRGDNPIADVRFSFILDDSLVYPGQAVFGCVGQSFTPEPLTSLSVSSLPRTTDDDIRGLGDLCPESVGPLLTELTPQYLRACGVSREGGRVERRMTARLQRVEGKWKLLDWAE